MACLKIWDSAPFLICFHCVYFKLVAHFQSNFNSCSLNSEYVLQNTLGSHDISKNLRQFLPPLYDFTVSVLTLWFTLKLMFLAVL